ncbi:MAG: hypothetical protein R3D78_13020 [Paracoccaceae bacterium]
MDHWIQAALIAFTSVSAAVVALIAISFITGQRLRPALKASPVPEVEQTVFLFDDQDLVDATLPARKLLEAGAAGGLRLDPARRVSRAAL